MQREAAALGSEHAGRLRTHWEQRAVARAANGSNWVAEALFTGSARLENVALSVSERWLSG